MMLFPFAADRITKEYLSAEQFAGCCDQLWSSDLRSPLPVDDRSAPRHGSLLYAKQDHARALFPGLERRRARVVLITAESDVPVGPDADIPLQVASWFAVNADHRCVESLPLGLGNSYCRRTSKADLLARVAGMPKTGLLYVNFRVENNPAVRAPLWEKFRSAEWAGSAACEQIKHTAADYARAMASHRCVLCPAGNGIDTHRMWEALYAGTIPVVESHPALDAFRDLPILFVGSLATLGRGQLEAAYGEMLGRTWNYEKLFLPWWRERFEQSRRRIDRQLSWCAFLARRLRRVR
ncbi:MAG: hypothetical protein IAE97_03430 [Chthoniobacterales bacterium]|nr:hypothetical protein [Chthoniobacterales bacterium]